MRKIIFLLLTVVVLISCKKPLDRNYNATTLPKDLQDISADNEVDSAAYIINMYLLRSAIFGDVVDGKTYRQIIDDANKLLAVEKIKKEREAFVADSIAIAEKENEAKLKAAVAIRIIEITKTNDKYYPDLIYKLTITNNTNKKIIGVDGRFGLDDIFDRQIDFIRVETEQDIEPQASVYISVKSGFKTPETIAEIIKKDTATMKPCWFPNAIIFNDGSSLKK